MGKHRAPRTSVLSSSVLSSSVLGSSAATTARGGAALGTVGAVAAVFTPGAAAAADGPVAQPRRDAVLVAVPAGARFAPPSEGELAALRSCEAGGQYSIATGNGFYGAYQFDLGTWRSLGLSGYPHQASPQVQDAAAAALMRSRGWGPWPSCSARLGLVPRPADAVPAESVVVDLGTYATSVRAAAPVTGRHRKPLGSGPATVDRARAPRATATAPAFGGHVLSVADVTTYRSDVRLWQERMAQRGWALVPDGHFGPRTQAVAKAFADEKAVYDALPGEVGAAVWAAAWTLPVT